MKYMMLFFTCLLACPPSLPIYYCTPKQYILYTISTTYNYTHNITTLGVISDHDKTQKKKKKNRGCRDLDRMEKLFEKKISQKMHQILRILKCIKISKIIL